MLELSIKNNHLVNEGLAKSISKSDDPIVENYWTTCGDRSKVIAHAVSQEFLAMDASVDERKHPGRVTISAEDKLLVGRIEAAAMLSISRRALDYLVANKQLVSRRIGTRVLIPLVELKRFSKADHPERLAG